MKCIAIDDEPLALDILKDHISKVPDLALLTTFRNAIEAAEYLRNNEVDLMFLDIQMPEITGIDFYKSLKKPPLVIFTTAYPEYAVEGFELNAIDYILKPISFERFEKALEKAREYFRFKREDEVETTELQDDYIYVKANQKLIKLSYDDIFYIEAFADYVKIYTPLKRIVTLQTMKNMERKLPVDRFVRLHRSFIAGINHIKAFSGSEVEVNGVKIPIGKNYKDGFLSLMKGKNIL